MTPEDAILRRWERVLSRLHPGTRWHARWVRKAKAEPQAEEATEAGLIPPPEDAEE